jgi:hypothetical protein
MDKNILYVTIYSKFAATITLYLAPSVLNALKVDTPSLFALFFTTLLFDTTFP